MEFRIDRGGEVGRYSSSRTQKVSGGFRQSFDQIQFSGQPAGMQGRVRQLTAQISQQIRTRPTCHEIEALRQQVQDGLYSVDPGQIAARIFTGTLADGGFDLVLGQIYGLGRGNGGAQTGIPRRIATVLRGDDDFLGGLGEYLAALGVLTALAMLDVGPLGMTCHDDPFDMQ